MVNPDEFLGYLLDSGFEFYAGVPDSQLKGFCDRLTHTLGIGRKHVIAPNEGNAVALAAGYHLATGRIGVVYLQNSGLGNAVNPITSLIDPKVYAVPVLFIVGWRGMPGIHDEPQHLKQGEITLDLLKVLDIDYTLLGRDTPLAETVGVFEDRFLPALRQGRSAAVVVQKDGFGPTELVISENQYTLSREDAIRLIIERMGPEDPVVSTTGKISREVYELRETRQEGHARDFLTVGSMGHASMIALEIAEQAPNRRVWCLDGDGAALMHMGAWALIGARSPKNLVHILLNNCAHESVGGQPTIAGAIDFPRIAQACGYRQAYRVDDSPSLKASIEFIATQEGPILLQVDVKNGSRSNLGRPKETPVTNKLQFMKQLQQGKPVQ